MNTEKEEQLLCLVQKLPSGSLFGFGGGEGQGDSRQRLKEIKGKTETKGEKGKTRAESNLERKQRPTTL